jgi:hypothetical protein
MSLNTWSMVCFICNKEFAYSSEASTRHNMMIHCQQHLDAFICNVCGKSVSAPAGLRSHQKIHQNEEEIVFRCFHCAKDFVRRERMAYHYQQMHSDNRLVKCTVCGKSYRGYRRLQKLSSQLGYAN